MEQNVQKKTKKELTKKQKIALSCGAIAALAAVVCLLLVLNSRAWLYDVGKWTDSEYVVGRIDYTYTINNSLIDFEETGTNLAATVPMTGGVKINDSSDVDPTAPNYEKHARQNFNEGVTVAHILIKNTSDFEISGSYTLDFSGMIENGNDIFYAVLPKGSVVDTAAKTVDGTEYKDYIKETVFGGSHADYDAMKMSLEAYYNKKPLLKAQDFHLSKGADDGSDTIVIDILFWSEYNSNLPFVNNDGTLKEADSAAAVKGAFSINININQKVSN